MSSLEHERHVARLSKNIQCDLIKNLHDQGRYQECMNIILNENEPIIHCFKQKFRMIGASKQMEKDLLQIWSMQIFLGLPNFEWRSSLMTWMNKIANHVIFNYLKNKQRQDYFFEEVEQSIFSYIENSSTTSVGSKIDKKRKKEILVHLLSQLTEEEQKIISLRFTRGLNFYEIAEEVLYDREKFNAVTQKLNRAIKKIQKELIHQGVLNCKEESNRNIGSGSSHDKIK